MSLDKIEAREALPAGVAAEPIVTYRLTDRSGAICDQGATEERARALAERLLQPPAERAPFTLTRVTVTLFRHEEVVETIEAQTP